MAPVEQPEQLELFPPEPPLARRVWLKWLRKGKVRAAQYTGS
jgi:hypothetical protein